MSRIRYNTSSLRRTSLSDELPWLDRLVTLVRISADGEVTQATTDRDKRAMIGTAGEQDLVLAAWPGQWSQDVFVVDDLSAARLSLGLPRYQRKPAPNIPRNSEFDHSYTEPAPDLWHRLASVPDLSPEGHRELAFRYVENSWVTECISDLVRRQDLDSEARDLILAKASERHARMLIAENVCTPDEAHALLDRFPDDADVLDAALLREDTGVVVLERIRKLTYDEAAHLWLKGKSWNSRSRPGLASAVLPVVLSSDPVAPKPNTGYGHERRHDRLALLRSLLADLPAAARLGVLSASGPGSLAQQAVLDDDEISEEELIVCLSTITLPTTKVLSNGIPDFARYLLRFPRLLSIAKEELNAATATLVSDGWDSVVAARAGRWKELKAVADAATSTQVLRELIRAATFDYTDARSVKAASRWTEPARYTLLDTLLDWPSAPESDHRDLLKRLSTEHLEDILQTKPQRSRISRLAREELHARRLSSTEGWGHAAPEQFVFPTDKELGAEVDPVEVLRLLLKNRGRHRDLVVKCALSSSFMTDELAWTLPVKDLERHSVFGPKLAVKIADLCGNSSSRWQALAESWAQPTQLLASTLFKRILAADT
jgi:hypothetical protein